MLTTRYREARDVDRVALAVNMLQRSHGKVPIAHLAAAACVSHKHLVTLFNRVAGAPPKTLARLYRLQHLIAAIDTEAPPTWTNLAYDFDYCDQAHFNKDFKRLTGRTPAEFLTQRRRAQAANPRHAMHWRLLPQG
jgi:methylphosphotriester-DNA--protein-cysteine methyltransferase